MPIIVATPYVNAYNNAVLGDNPIAYYPMQEMSGTEIVDLSGNTGNGTISGDYTLGQSGPATGVKSVQFGGTSAFVDLPDGFSDFTNGLTIEVWGNPTAVSAWARFVELAEAGIDINAIHLYRENNTDAVSGVFSQTGGGHATVPGALQLGVWKHFVYVYKTNFTSEMYVNGILSDTGTGPGTIPNVLRTQNYLGKSTSIGDPLFQGFMTRAAIYDHALTSTQILNHYNIGI